MGPREGGSTVSGEQMVRHTGPDSTKPLQVIYDSDCFACRSLAGFIKKKAPGHISFTSREQFLAQKPHYLQSGDMESLNELWVLVPGRKLLKGSEAWELLVNNFQSLRALNWLAEKAGMRGVPARTLRAAGHGLRSLCFRCKKRGPGRAKV